MMMGTHGGNGMTTSVPWRRRGGVSATGGSPVGELGSSTGEEARPRRPKGGHGGWGGLTMGRDAAATWAPQLQLGGNSREGGRWQNGLTERSGGLKTGR